MLANMVLAVFGDVAKALPVAVDNFVGLGNREFASVLSKK